MTDTLRPPSKCTTQDYARRALIKVRALCCALSETGMKHDEIASHIGAHPRTLSSWKQGTTVPHWAVDALESLVMKTARKVGT
jgi:uncharacterized protein YjcR